MIWLASVSVSGCQTAAIDLTAGWITNKKSEISDHSQRLEDTVSQDLILDQ
jgi:hypothetical protein